jgi:conflict system STAND superfamily ATPase/SIR2-like protein
MPSSPTTNSEQEAQTKGIAQPYKFLDYYRKNDRQLFFGRERETENLVSDIVTARLVILFAKTGSGKSSLINAGVRPRLEELDYQTFWIRVEQDPIEAAVSAFRRENFCLDGKPFVECLKGIVRQLSKPVVLFFDQFEEFFLVPASLDSEALRRFKLAAQRFVADVGELYRNRESGVHFVFSMREEFFHEMDVFRSEIPTIFSAESSLRLRWLDDIQARAAIIQPALAAGRSFSEEFTSALIEDLKDSERASEGIEPASLQIVCDTIWTRECFDLDAYRALGRAKGILESRLEKDIASLADAELKAFERIVPELTHSERQTKRLRGVDAIEQSLNEAPGSLDAVIAKLEKLRLVVKSKHSTGVFIEWTSDYVAGRARRLKDYAGGTRLERLLHRVRDKAEAKRKDLGERAQQRDFSTIEREDFETISRDAHLLRSLSTDDAHFLFRTALELGRHRELWFKMAANAQVDTWQVLRKQITQEDTQSDAQSRNSVRLLGEVGAMNNGSTQTRALELLKLAMEQRDLANDALEAAAQIGSEGAVQLLAEALTDGDLAAKTIKMLGQLKTSLAIRVLAQTVDALGPFSLDAGRALSRIADAPDLDRAAREARQALAALLAKRGIDLFRLALEKGIEMEFWLQKAQESGVPVWEILRSLLGDQKMPEGLAQNVARLLSQMKDPRAEELRTLPRTRRGQMQPISSEPALLRELDDKTWDRLLKRIRDDKCTPVLGSGACTAPPMGADPAEWAKLKYPSKEQIALKFAADYAYPLDDQTKLERVAKYVAATDDIFAPKEAFAKHYGSIVTPNFSALPNEPHRVLADLPFPVYLTSNFDDWMYRALIEYKKKDARLAICRWNRHIPDKAPSFDPEFAYSVANPLVYHFYGCMPWAEAAVVTEDDYLEFLINISRDYKSLAHRVDRALGGALLFLGYTLSDWDFLVLFRLFANKLRDSGNTHIAVQPEPSDMPGDQAEKAAKAVKYLDSYFGSAQVKIYWGTCQQFCEELRVRWEAFSRG